MAILDIIKFPKRLRLRAVVGGLSATRQLVLSPGGASAHQPPRELWRPVLRLAMGVSGLSVVVRPLRADPL